MICIDRPISMLSTMNDNTHSSKPAGRHQHRCDIVLLDGHTGDAIVVHPFDPFTEDPFNWSKTTNRLFLRW